MSVEEFRYILSSIQCHGVVVGPRGVLQNSFPYISNANHFSSELKTSSHFHGINS